MKILCYTSLTAIFIVSMVISTVKAEAVDVEIGIVSSLLMNMGVLLLFNELLKNGEKSVDRVSAGGLFASRFFSMQVSVICVYSLLAMEALKIKLLLYICTFSLAGFLLLIRHFKLYFTENHYDARMVLAKYMGIVMAESSIRILQLFFDKDCPCLKQDENIVMYIVIFCMFMVDALTLPRNGTLLVWVSNLSSKRGCVEKWKKKIKKKYEKFKKAE